MMDGNEVVERLKRRFPVGTRPELRLALYTRLGRLVEEYGEPVLHVVATAAADAASARNPGHYFAFVVMRRLRDRGILEEMTI